RFVGDVLLSTPLIRSLHAAHPGAAIDALVFAGTESVLEGNPDLRQVLTAESRAPRWAQAALWRRLWRKYDLAVVAETGDRPHVYGWLAARRRAGLLPPQWEKRWWKQLSLTCGVVSPPEQARPLSYERLARAMGIAWKPEMVAPSAGMPAIAWRDVLGFDAERERFAVLHLAPRFRYKRWLAAACATPTVALFGPTDPRLWGPLPRDGLERPYEKVVALQRRGNVALLQEPSLPCVPCQEEGCEKHRESRSDCLDAMQAERVI